MTNRLAKTNSPYLLQHAENPVDWYPWGPEALQKAAREDKPVFLSIGYAACHWCHVMAHESFEDPGTAEIMNRHFVNIKVDREERPDLDSIYMTAVVALTGQGGWPMSVFLTPQGEPFYGGTYFPPTQRYNLPSFRDILTGVARAWDENRERLLQSSAELARHIRAGGRVEAGQPDQLEPAMLDRAALSLAQSYDWKHGGWGRAPKFPQPMAIEFLLQRATGGDRLALDVATHALKAMARGGMYDVIGGGFARYSTDDRWLVPHFEKMLYDNALLADAYLHAYLITRDEEFRRVCEATLDFVAREMRDASGAFYSSLDADSEGKEGKYYIWAWEEIKAAIPDQIDFDLCTAAYGISESGNFEGNNVLQRTLDDEQLAQKFSLPAEEIRARLESARQRLLAERSRRVRPGTDDKALASWNALMLKAFAEAARFLDRPDYAKVAVQNAEFLTSELLAGGKLQRAWRNGQAAHAGYLEDYAATIQGLLALYQSVPDVRWFAMAKELARQMLEHFQDPVGGFFDTSDQHEHLLVRPKDLQDNAIPCGNSLAAYALLELAAFDGEQAWREIAERSLGMFEAAVQQYPTAFAYWLCAFRFAIEMTTEVAITWPLPAGRPWSSIRSGQAPADPGDSQLLIRELWRAYRPNLVAALSPYPVPEGSPQLLADRPPIKGLPTAYVCRSFVCQLPVTTPQALAEQLQEMQEH